MNIIYDKVVSPVGHKDYAPVTLSKKTMEEHLQNVLTRMKELKLDSLIIYADREHGSNFAYLTGFEPRFEEALLILHKDKKCFLLFGNENLKMHEYSFIHGTVIHVPHFSLPCQPMEGLKTLKELIASARIQDNTKVGCAGWKYFTSRSEDNRALFDIPAFIMDTLQEINQHGKIVNASEIFLDPEKGVRNIVNANELAHYEFGSGLASAKVLDAINSIAIGKTEMEIADKLTAYGQPTTVTTICASGERFTDAVVFPRNKKIELGDKFSITLGLRGGLTSRSAYIASKKSELNINVQDYIEKVSIPYFIAAVTWLEMIGIGVACKNIYERMEEVIPKSKYNWTLNPGHFTGQDEWTVSPIFPDSSVVLKSGMLLQMDIIISVSGYGGANAEDGIAIADESLREELKERYPKTWSRIQSRRKYMMSVLGIQLKEEVLPLSDLCGYVRPLLLNRECALRKSS